MMFILVFVRANTVWRYYEFYGGPPRFLSNGNGGSFPMVRLAAALYDRTAQYNAELKTADSFTFSYAVHLYSAMCGQDVLALYKQKYKKSWMINGMKKWKNEYRGVSEKALWSIYAITVLSELTRQKYAGSNTSTVVLRVVGGEGKGSLESETVKYGHESHGTRTRKWLLWRGPAAKVNDRPVLSSERAPHTNKPAAVWQ
jgi:hypothetical protein